MPEYRSQLNSKLKPSHPVVTLLTILLVFVGYVVGSLTINQLIAQPYWHPKLTTTKQMQALNLFGDEVDMVFVGSSHTLAGVNPLVFDANRDAVAPSFNLRL